MERRTKHVLITLLASFAVALVVGLIFIYSGLYNVGADKENSSFKRWLLETVKSSSISSRSGDLEIPDLSNREVVSRGLAAYDSSCSGCHGKPGQKPGKFSEALNPSAPWLGGISEPPNDGALRHWFWATKHGIEMTGMPAWNEMKEDEEIWAIVAALRAFPELSEAEYQKRVEEAKADDGDQEGEEESEESDAESDAGEGGGPDAGAPDAGGDAGSEEEG